MKKLPAVLALLASPLLAQDTKISDLTAGGAVQSTDKFVIARAGANYSILGSALCASGACTMTAPILGPTGCANPAYGFTGDTNAGLCLGAVNEVSAQTAPLTTASSSSMVLTSAVATLIYYNATSVYSAVQAQDAEVSLQVGGLKQGVLAAGSWIVGHTNLHDTFRILTPALGAGAFQGTLTYPDLTATHAWTLPNAAGDVAVIASTGFPVRTAAQTWATRSFASGDGSVVVTNPAGTAGDVGLTVDSSVYSRFSQSTADATGACQPGTFHLRTDTNEAWFCTNDGADTWTKVRTGTVAVATGGTGATTVTGLLQGNGTSAFTAVANSSTVGQILRVTGAAAYGWGALDLADTDAITNDLPFANLTAAGAASKLLGRGDSGAGDYQEITLGSNLSMSGTTLSASGGAASFDPTTVELLEEFGTGNVTDGSIGQLGVTFIALATGTLSAPDAEASHPGIIRLNSHATNDNSGVWIFFKPNSGSNFLPSMESTEFLLDALVKVGSNGTAITSTSIAVGLANDSSPAAASHAAWIRRDTDLSDTAFVFAICDASGAAGCNSAGDNTDTNTELSTITPTAGNYYRFRIRRVASGVGGNPTWYFRVNDETEKTFCSSGCDDTLTNVPTATQGRFAASYLTRTTTGVLSADVDYIYLKVTGLTRY